MNIGKSNKAARSSGIKIRWIGMNGLNAAQISYETNISEIFYVYYDRQYHEPYGTGHDGNPSYRVAPVRSEEAARTRPRDGSSGERIQRSTRRD